MFERIKTFMLDGQIKYREAKLLNDQMIQLSNYITPEADAGDWKLLGSNTEKGLDDIEQEDIGQSHSNACSDTCQPINQHLREETAIR